MEMRRPSEPSSLLSSLPSSLPEDPEPAVAPDAWRTAARSSVTVDRAATAIHHAADSFATTGRSANA